MGMADAFEFEIILDGVRIPDARLDLWGRRKRTEVVLLEQLYERVFCVNCGKAAGAVTKGSPIFFLCDECVEKWGPPAGCIEVIPK